MYKKLVKHGAHLAGGEIDKRSLDWYCSGFCGGDRFEIR
jgi:hypothetical protein